VTCRLFLKSLIKFKKLSVLVSELVNCDRP
jgi:hypothetical protein